MKSREERREIASRTWSPRQKWTLAEAIEIIRQPTTYAKLLTKSMIGLDWRINEANESGVAAKKGGAMER